MMTERKPHGWMVCYAFMLAFFLVMVPSLAYADTYVATEESAVRAAMVYLGYDPDEGESTNKLVTAFYDATSGDVYTGWQSFVNGLYQPLDTVNYNEQWWSPADGFMFSFQVDAARTDAAKIYAAWKKTIEGSGGGGVVGDYVYITVQHNFPQNVFNVYAGPSSSTVQQQYKNYDSVASNYPVLDSITTRVDGQVWQRLLDTLPDGYDIYSQGDQLIGVPSDTEFIMGTSGGITYIKSKPAGNYVTLGGATISRRCYEFEDGKIGYTIGGNAQWTSAGNGALGLSLPYFSKVSTQAPPEPEPEPEPEPPTPPEPPRDPEPPTPDPTQPSQTIDLQGIIDRLDIIIRNQVVLINWLDDAFASVNQNIQWLGELVDESFGWLWEVLEKLQASVDGGISRITTWLEMIYNKIGGQGSTVSRPNIDTPTPWDDFLSWLEGIFKSLLDKIFGVTPTALQNLLSGLADLTRKFPFSIPWDLAALFALFVHEPVTPVFDVPLMVPFLNAPLPLHVDCTQWNDLAAICRDGETVIFAAWLLLKIPDLYKHLSDVSGAD